EGFGRSRPSESSTTSTTLAWSSLEATSGGLTLSTRVPSTEGKQRRSSKTSSRDSSGGWHELCCHCQLHSISFQHGVHTGSAYCTDPVGQREKVFRSFTGSGLGQVLDFGEGANDQKSWSPGRAARRYSWDCSGGNLHPCR